MKCLAEIFVVKIGIFRQSFGPIRVECRDLEDPAYRVAEASDTRLPVHDLWVQSDAVERNHRGSRDLVPGSRLEYVLGGSPCKPAIPPRPCGVLSMMPAFDPAAVRADFPILSREIAGKPLVYLDNGATTQKPRRVIEALSKFFSQENANIHRGVHSLSRDATDAYDKAREFLKECLAAPATHELLFVRGATEAINLVTHCFASRLREGDELSGSADALVGRGFASRLREGDEIVLTVMEHHANIVPWQVLAQRTGAIVRVAGLRDNGELDLGAWKSLFTDRTRVAAFTQVSNVLGTQNPVAEMTAFARERGVMTLIDGAQAVPHQVVDLAASGGDFFVFSGHKVFAPDGVGVLVAPRDFLDASPPYQTGGDMIERVSFEGTTFRKSPERFEAGTPNISGAIGLAEAFRYLAGIDRAAATRHEEHLASLCSAELAKMDGIRLIGTAPGKAAIVAYHYAHAHPHDVGTILDTEGVAIRVGHHCAQPLMDYLKVPATARASFSFYNNEADVEAFLRAMRKVERFFA